MVVATTVLAVGAALLVANQPNVPPLLNIDEISISQLTEEESAQPDPQWIAPVDQSILSALSEIQEALETADDSMSADITSDSDEIRWFNGRPLRPAHTMMMTVTAYSPDARSCGGSADGITASGYSVYTNGMKLAAADTGRLPFGSLISVPGYDNGHVVPVLDRGGAIKGNRLDVLFPTHEQARQFGVKKVQVTVWDYADGEPSDYKPIYKAADSVVARPTSGNAG